LQHQSLPISIMEAMARKHVIVCSICRRRFEIEADIFPPDAWPLIECPDHVTPQGVQCAGCDLSAIWKRDEDHD
jgi:hypothetical protein